jgi:phage FluMu protein gp41
MTEKIPDARSGTLAMAVANLKAAALGTQAAMAGLKLVMRQPGIQTPEVMREVTRLADEQLAAFPALVDTFTQVMREGEAVKTKHPQE